MADEIQLQFRYTEEDYVRAMRFHLARRMRLRLDVTVAVALALLSSFFLARDGDSSVAWLWILSGAASAILLAIVFTAHFVVPIRKFRTQPKLHGEYTLIFRRDGIRFRTTSIDSRLEWTIYSELRSDEHSHLLIYGDGFTAIPRRVFPNSASDAAFVELVRQCVRASGSS